jgi:predicted transcriptional regulator
MFWEGRTYVEIASELGYTNQQVMNVIHDPSSKEILAQLQDGAMDSMEEVHARLNEAAPRILNRKIQLAMSPDEQVANRACTDLLHMAGHMPVKRVRIEQETSIDEKYKGLTEDEIKAQVLNQLTGRGPDGKILN